MGDLMTPIRDVVDFVNDIRPPMLPELPAVKPIIVKQLPELPDIVPHVTPPWREETAPTQPGRTTFTIPATPPSKRTTFTIPATPTGPTSSVAEYADGTGISVDGKRAPALGSIPEYPGSELVKVD